MKDIYFLSGLPRSGNTLLSSLLNQNPKIFSSPNSPLLDILSNIDKIAKINESAIVANFDSNIDYAMRGFSSGFYSHIEQPIIFDRSKAWGSKESMYMAYKYITDKPKIIYTVRDIPSILGSFISLIGEDRNNFIDISISQNNIKAYGNQTQNDLRCDWLMNNQVGYCLSVLTEILQTNIPVCLIEYDDLVSSPQIQLNKIYDFLEIERFDHNFENITKKEQETLAVVGLPEKLHDVKPKIEKTPINLNYILNEKIQNKYSNLEFWRKK